MKNTHWVWEISLFDKIVKSKRTLVAPKIIQIDVFGKNVDKGLFSYYFLSFYKSR